LGGWQRARGLHASPFMVSRSNASTCLPWLAVPVEEAPQLSTAYTCAVATERVRNEPAAGYRLYWMASGRFGSCDVPIDPMAHVVVGRHAFCDAVLDGDPSIALRHLIVRATRLDDGCPRLSVVDLHTNIGFQLNDGRHERSMAVTGPIAFRVGAYAIVALPGGESLPDALPEPVCVRALAAHPYRDAPVSSVTLLPPPLQIGAGETAAGEGLQLVLQGSRGSATTRLSSTDLELGVLVGRAPKCADALRNVLDNGISRVHLLLRRDVSIASKTRPCAYDLASTQGTYVFGRRIRSTVIGDGMDIGLGAVNTVRMHVHALP